MTNNAEEYADSIAADIEKSNNMGAPFGWRNDHTGEPVEESELPDEDEEGERHDEDGHEIVPASGMDYLSDVLDIQYIVSGERAYRAARVLIAFGGPTAWINTQTEQLEVAWWSAPEYRTLPREFIEGLDEALEELWEMGA